MRLSSILLTSAAGLISTGAFAADLPSRKAAPVEYVRVCSTYGEGFFYIPGTDTCIRIGGRASYEFNYAQPFARGDSTTGTRATGRIFLDARTATDYGLLRAFVRYDIQRRTGSLYSGTSTSNATAFTGRGVDFNGVLQTQVDLNRAFVQLGGLTAGRSQSFFEFYAGDLEYVGTTSGSSIQTNLLAYTASFGSGFSATLSIEDPVERRNTITNFAQPTAASSYAGSGMPDVVGVLRVEQGWGAAQLSGAIHQVRTVGLTPVTGVVGTAIGYAAGTEYGFAVNGGVQFNLPFAEGDQLWLQGTYTKGATNYINSNPFGYGSGSAGGFGGLGGLMMPDAVVVANGGPGSLSLTQIWGITAAALHYWTPTVRQAVFASYMAGDMPSTAFVQAGGPVPGNYFRDYRYWTVGTNVTWSPVKDLDIGAEVNYLQFQSQNGGVYSTVTGDPALKIYKNEGAVVGRFKIVRDF